MELSFIIIEDRELDCFIVQKLIERVTNNARIDAFPSAVEVIEGIKNDPAQRKDHLTIIFLDIMLPVMSGFEFIETFETLDEEVRANYFIVAFTSSMNKSDFDRLNGYQSVHHVFRKPVTQADISSVIDEAQAFCVS